MSDRGKRHKRMLRGILLASWLLAAAGWLSRQAPLMIAGLLLLNGCACIVMGWDKRAAKRGAERIPEASLFLLAALGGAAGVLAGMYLFRHKTRHASFLAGVPLLLLVQAVLAVWLFPYV
jgi:uncharacterized membrane protein YsdA (DUF1294 family)